jgi:hypothetical protein
VIWVDRVVAVAVGAAGVGAEGDADVAGFREGAAGVLAAAANTIVARAVAARAAATVAATVGSLLAPALLRSSALSAPWALVRQQRACAAGARVRARSHARAAWVYGLARD